MGGFKEMVAIFWFLGFTQTLLCSALVSNLRGGEKSVVLSSTYSPFPYKKKRSQIVVESVYPDLSQPELDHSTTFRPYPTLVVTGSGMHQQVEDLPQSVQTDQITQAPPPWEKQLKQLTQLLSAVSGDELETFVDNRFDSKVGQENRKSLEMNVDPSPLPPVTYFPLK